MSMYASNGEHRRSTPWNARKNHAICSFLGLSLGIWALLAGLSQAKVVINEVMASNVASFADPQGDFDDWIELYNAGDGPVNVGGMYLSDDPEVPTMWQIPWATPGVRRSAPAVSC